MPTGVNAEISISPDRQAEREGQGMDLADSLARYMYKVDPPKIAFAYAESTLPYLLPAKTPVVALDAYLTTPGAGKTFTMKFQFDKAMDRESVEMAFHG